MQKSRLLLSASGVLTGALLFGASPAFAQGQPVFDNLNYALQGAIKAIESTMSNTLTSHHQPAHRDRAAWHHPRRHLERQPHHPSHPGVYPERQLRQGPGRRAKPARRRRANLARPLRARHAQRPNPRRAHDELAPLHRHRRRTDHHRQLRVILESRAIYFGRRRQSRRGGAEPAGFLRPGAGSRSDRATAFFPLLLAGRGDRRPLLLVLDTQRRPARLNPVRNRHA